MTHRDYVLAAIRHEQTERVPYTRGFEEGVDKELDAYYGSTRWRETLQDYTRYVGGMDSLAEKRVDETHVRDAFGALWRTDKRPWHLEVPALPEPRMDLIRWPTIEAFPRHVVEKVAELTGPKAERFSFVINGWGLFEQSWRIRGFENTMMDCILNEDFYEALLDRLTALRLEMVERCKDIPADGLFFGVSFPTATPNAFRALASVTYTTALPFRVPTTRRPVDCDPGAAYAGPEGGSAGGGAFAGLPPRFFPQ